MSFSYIFFVGDTIIINDIMHENFIIISSKWVQFLQFNFSVSNIQIFSKEITVSSQNIRPNAFLIKSYAKLKQLYLSIPYFYPHDKKHVLAHIFQQSLFRGVIEVTSIDK